MEANILTNERLAPIKTRGRFATLDFARGLAIFLMIGLHTQQHTLNIDELLADLNNLPLVNLVALVVIPFYGRLAGLFLIVSAISNMVSSYRDLERSNSVRSIVIKQVVGGVLLLIFAMLCEALIGYNGVFGNFFQFLDYP